ncbi:MAG TPA: DNA-formamidopyrimidine glycosylase family protein, partial [Kofleriaceae bacterium]
MPELPDVTVYVERLRALTVGRPLEAIRIASPFVLRTVSPSPGELRGAAVESVERLGKRIVIGVAGERFLVIHLMIAGRLRWKPRGEKLPAKVGLAAFDFPNGSLVFTEASPKKRASIHLVAGRAGLAEFDRGGLDVFAATPAAFAGRLRGERHTVKRALTDPTLFDGIGNAYSDEILHAARLSPFRMTSSITDAEIAVLHRACIDILTLWTRRFRDEIGAGFPDKVTAFRPEMAVHGKYGQPCPVCSTKVQRIVYADNEANYCPTCQT